MGGQHFPTRGVHDLLCPMDVSQPEETSTNLPKYPHPHQTHLSLQTPLITGLLKLQPCLWGQNQTCPAPCQLQDVEASLPGAQAVRKETLAGITK